MNKQAECLGQRSLRSKVIVMTHTHTHTHTHMPDFYTDCYTCTRKKRRSVCGMKKRYCCCLLVLIFRCTFLACCVIWSIFNDMSSFLNAKHDSKLRVWYWRTGTPPRVPLLVYELCILGLLNLAVNGRQWSQLLYATEIKCGRRKAQGLIHGMGNWSLVVPHCFSWSIFNFLVAACFGTPYWCSYLRRLLVCNSDPSASDTSTSSLRSMTLSYKTANSSRNLKAHIADSKRSHNETFYIRQCWNSGRTSDSYAAFPLLTYLNLDCRHKRLLLRISTNCHCSLMSGAVIAASLYKTKWMFRW